jgi:hypothetical protein
MSRIHWVAQGTGTPKLEIETRLLTVTLEKVMGEYVI